METIPKSNCVKVGFILKSHGIHGELVIRFQEEYYETLEEVDTDKKAKDLCGLSVFVDRDDVIEFENEMSPHALIGYQLFDETLGLIGVITEVNDFSGNVLLSVEYQGKEAMVPLNDDLIVRLDEDLHEIELRIPEGLFDLDDE